MAANVIYRGTAVKETVNLPVSGAYTPGSFVTRSATALTQATAVSGNRLLALANRTFYNQGPDDAYVSGETGVAVEIAPNDVFSMQMAAATYTYGQELTVAASGRLAAAASTNIVVAHFTDAALAGTALSAGARADVTISNFYTKA